MTVQLIITLCVLLLFAYIFDISAARTKIPSVVLLLLLGWGVRQGTILLDLQIPNLMPLLPFLGTMGLILIVLDGAMELEVDRSKLPLVGKSFFMALLSMVIISGLLGWIIYRIDGIVSFKDALANAVPFAVISSAIAIPSSRNLGAANREFVTYESSFSDILGVVLFNFFVFNKVIDAGSVIHSLTGFLIILLVTVVATAGLIFLLSKIKHHVKFVPIILMIILIYAVTEIWHLPALLFIILFGLIIGNINVLRRHRLIRRLQPDALCAEVKRFHELITEFTFLVRASFFLLFGFLLETSELLNSHTIVWALLIAAGIFLFRYLLLKIFRLPAQELWFIAPRGLITILLFLSIPMEQSSALVNKSLMVQVVIISALVMMGGSLFPKGKTPGSPQAEAEPDAPDSDEPEQAESDAPDSDEPEQAESDAPDSDEPEQAESDAPDSDEPEQAEPSEPVVSGSAEFGKAAPGPTEPSSSGQANPECRARPNL
ncbi:MAG TPA: cation:proton antiporter [Bacteroidales bacterium]|nr:cation:proton antiporter [Bacteroidales bacterium]